MSVIIKTNQQYKVTLRTGQEVIGTFDKETEPRDYLSIMPSEYMEFSTEGKILHLSRQDIMNIIQVKAPVVETPLTPEEELFRKSTLRYEKTYPPLFRDAISVMNESGANVASYTVYGVVKNKVERPLYLQVREPVQLDFDYFLMDIGAFSRGIVPGKTRIIPSDGEIMVALPRNTIPNTGEPVQVSGVLEIMPKEFGLYAFVLLKHNMGTVAAAFRAPFEQSAVQGKRLERKELIAQITTPSIYTKSTVPMKIDTNRFRKVYGYTESGALKRVFRRNSIIKDHTKDEMTRRIFATKEDIVSLEKVFAHNIVALDVYNFSPDYTVRIIEKTLGLFGEVPTTGLMTRGRMHYMIGKRDVTVIKAWEEPDLDVVYAEVHKKAKSDNKYILVGYSMKSRVPMAHLMIQDGNHA